MIMRLKLKEVTHFEKLNIFQLSLAKISKLFLTRKRMRIVKNFRVREILYVSREISYVSYTWLDIFGCIHVIMHVHAS